ncbi:hypothetical protein PanWU01x14_143560, partial [Parasponia andersonii]
MGGPGPSRALGGDRAGPGWPVQKCGSGRLGPVKIKYSPARARWSAGLFDGQNRVGPGRP